MRQKIVMLCIEKLCVGEPTVLPKLPTVLNALYDAEVLEEGTKLVSYSAINIILRFSGDDFIFSQLKRK